MQHMQESMMRLHTSVSTSYRVISSVYLVVLVVVLSSTGKCDPPSDDNYRLSTQNNVITQTSINPSFWTVVNRKKSQNTHVIAESTSQSLTSSPSPYNQMKTQSTSSAFLKISTNTDSESQEYPMMKITTSVYDRTTTLQPESTMSDVYYDVSLQTTVSSWYETIANVCDTDQVKVTNKPVHINASTLEIHCSLLINAPNSTAISVSVTDSDIHNVSTYFYIELLESQILNNSKRIKLIALDNIPCVMILQGNQFRFHFQNTKMKVSVCNTESEESLCSGTIKSHILCKITPYGSKIQTSQSQFDAFKWDQRISVVITQFQAKCMCDCPKSCECTLGYRQWLSTCIQDNSTLSDLIVYTPTRRGLSFNNTDLHAIQQDAFLGLEEVVVLILSNNKLSMLQPTVCQNLPKLQVLKLNNNRLVNLTSNSFSGPCEHQLRVLYLQSNKFTYLPYDLFQSTSKLSYLNLKHNRLVQLSSNLFNSLEVLVELWLSENAISTLPAGVFDSLSDLEILDLSGNEVSTLQDGVFEYLRNLRTLDLSGNTIFNLPVDAFDLLGRLDVLDLSGNDVATLPLGVFDSLQLTILVLSGNNISMLPVGVFDSLNWLATLDLSGNTIFTLPVGVFDSQGWLYTLDLSVNNISTLPVGVFNLLGVLSILDLSGNTISTLPVGVFNSLHVLLILDLSDNRLLFLTDYAIIPISGTTLPLQTLNLSGNNISILYESVFHTLNELLNLDLSNNELNSLPSELFLKLGKLISLSLCCNTLKINASQTFKSLKRLKILDLSKNNIEQFPSHLFEYTNKLILLNLCCNHLNEIASQTFGSLSQLKILDISKNNLQHLPPHLFESTSNLLSLEISDNNLRTIPVDLFRKLDRLSYLNMSKNSLSRLPLFNAQGQLQVLDITENQLTTPKEVIFENLKNLTFLSMAKNSITKLPSYVFFKLDNIEFINASYNTIQKIGSKVVSGETNLKTFDLRGNEMFTVTPHSFTSFTNSTVIVDKYGTCCFLNEHKCISMEPREEYLTCKRMLRDVVLRISVWVLGLSAFICNAIAYCVRSRKQQAKIKVQTLFISHLALADLLMGVNMLILAIADVYFGQYFPSYAHIWRRGFVCKFAGFLSIFSSEGSVFFITLISIDRMLRIKYSFGGHRLEIKSARICVTLTWLMALLISVIPISLTKDEGNFYSISEVCVGIPIVRRHLTSFMNKSTEIKTTTISSSPEFFSLSGLGRYKYDIVVDFSIKHLESGQNIPYTVAENAGSQVGSIYSIVVFISVNLFCFIIVACCYVYIFIKARRTAGRATGSQNRNDELRMAKKMFAIVFTDFCCWVPLSFVCILTQSGVIEVSPEMYAWTVGFILPINSSINPFLYVLYETMSDRLKKKQEDRKAREEIEMQVRWKQLKTFGLQFIETPL